MAVFNSFGQTLGDQVRWSSEYVNARVVLASIEEKETIPSDYNMVVINSTAPVYVKIGDSSVAASIPADVSDGTASELNPTSYAIKSDQTTISIISPSNCIVTLAYYKVNR